MGDYTKLIVNCSVEKREDIDALREEILNQIILHSSAYHCGGEVLHIGNEWHHRTDITLVTQAKYGQGISEFLEWLKPQVINGFGESDIFAIEMDEYSNNPIIHKKELSE